MSFENISIYKYSVFILYWIAYYWCWSRVMNVLHRDCLGEGKNSFSCESLKIVVDFDSCSSASQTWVRVLFELIVIRIQLGLSRPAWIRLLIRVLWSVVQPIMYYRLLMIGCDVYFLMYMYMDLLLWKSISNIWFCAVNKKNVWSDRLTHLRSVLLILKIEIL